MLVNSKDSFSFGAKECLFLYLKEGFALLFCTLLLESIKYL